MSNFEILITFICISIALSCGTLKSQEIEDWVQLYNDRAETWYVSGEADWTIESGILTGQNKRGTGYAVTNSVYGNFELTADFFPDREVNSGIFFRCNPDSIGAVHCYEANIWDNHVNQEWRTGAIVRHTSPLAKVSTIGKWNTYRIKARGTHIEMWINGQKTVDFQNDALSGGVIALQAFGEGGIRFRNVRIRELSP